MTPTHCSYAFGVIAVFLAELALIGAKSKIGLRAGAAFVAIAASVTLLVGAMAAISLVPTENLEKGFVAIEACLVSLFAVVGLLSGGNAASMGSRCNGDADHFRGAPAAGGGPQRSLRNWDLPERRAG